VKVQTQPHPQATVLIAHGPLIGDEVADLRRAIDSAAGPATKRVIIDMSDVPYLDSAGIEMLAEVCGTQLFPLTRPKLAALSETCREALDLTDVLPRLEVYDTVENALRSCQR